MLDDKRNVESMEHFCTVPGVFDADEVIVQSEDVRQTCINVLTESFDENSRPMWELHPLIKSTIESMRPKL